MSTSPPGMSTSPPGLVWPCPGVPCFALDFETAAPTRNRTRVLQLGVFGVDAASEFYAWTAVVDGQTDVGKDPRNLLNTTEDEIRAARPMQDHLPQLCALLEGSIVVMHNAPFDWSVLEAECRRANVRPPHPLAKVCTLDLARYRLDLSDLNTPSRRLVDLAPAFGIPLKTAHHALDDARATFWLFIHLATRHRPYFLRPPTLDAIVSLRGRLAWRDTTTLPPGREWAQARRIVASVGNPAVQPPAAAFPVDMDTYTYSGPRRRHIYCRDFDGPS